MFSIFAPEFNLKKKLVMANNSEKTDPWYVIALKAVAYIVGLLLAGIGTTASAQMLGLM